jgi:hypothetical protein
MAKDMISIQQHRQNHNQNHPWSIDIAIPSPPPTASKPLSPSPSFNESMNNDIRHQRVASDDQASSVNATGFQKSRKVACDVCRERKVRCDRNQPSCGRCSRLGSRCKYSPPDKPESSKIDISQVLETLHARLGSVPLQGGLSEIGLTICSTSRSPASPGKPAPHKLQPSTRIEYGTGALSTSGI